MYEAGRPEYPAEAVQWMLEPVSGGAGRRVRVADVGAGTGKLTRVVSAVGGDVVAVDPDAYMLAALRDAVRDVPTFIGTAESLPFQDAEFDAVVLGQAWHWVDPVTGSREIGRVLRDGGVLGLIWNLRDDSDAWARRLDAIMPEGKAQEMLAAGTPPVRAPFGESEERVWHWTRQLTRSEVGDMVRSRSFYITATPEQCAGIDGALDELLDDLGLDSDETIDLPYVTRAYRVVRR
ncbi:class I SAM-dependent methyltransferase [Tsukamurella soli]|uniref:Class I SAM-dependent methyltransferase n=1 Tax=Tsukamurella soli TaxID=644556 RepID=A0ABP8KA11_9ACTN